MAEKAYAGKSVFYFPLDFSRAVARTFRRIRPSMVVLMELEVWPNFMRRARREGVPVVVANGRITERSFARFRMFGPLAGGLLGKVDLFLVQTDEYRERLLALGLDASRVAVTGNIKFDTLSTALDPARAAGMRREMGVSEEQALVIGGSTHRSEEKALLDAYRELKAGDARVRLLVVPRHRERFDEVAGLLEAEGAKVFRRSSLSSGARPAGDEVLLGDTLGELERLYEAADVAFVGGTLIDHGGQNMAEPAAKGRPVVFGPSVFNFPEASKALLDAGAARMISGPEGSGRSAARVSRRRRGAQRGRGRARHRGGGEGRDGEDGRAHQAGFRRAAQTLLNVWR